MIRQNRHIDFSDLPEKEEMTPVSLVEEQETLIGSLPEEDIETTSQQNKQAKPRFRVKELLDGTILVRENTIKQLPFILFLTALGIIYIGNRFHAERMVRQINSLKTEVGNLRTEQITTTSELMNISRPSQVSALVQSKNLGLKESMEPPKKLKRR